MVPQMRLFREWLERERGLAFADYEALWTWSTTDLAGFWRSVWDYHELESPAPVHTVVGGQAMPGTTWFAGAQTNYARQVFRHVALADAAGVSAIVAEDERGGVSELTWTDLQRRSASLALELRRRGVVKGDRVAAWLPNIPEAVVAFLACASLGAIWTVCSPDMGTPAVLDRFRQISPKVLIAIDGIFYGGKASDRSVAVAELRRNLPSVQTLLLIRSGYATAPVPDSDDFSQAQSRNDDEVAAFEPEWLPFDHPLWILYSSGTTGLPKAIVHGHGGIILSACAGHLHLDLGASYLPNTLGDRFHWYSATGWVMWNVQVGALLAGTTICLYDGSPSGNRAQPDWGRLWSFAARHRVSWFGAGAVFYSSCCKAGLNIEGAGDLSAVRALGSTGSPLVAEVQDWVSARFAAIGRPQIWWCNISGGTDIAAAFLAGNRELPVRPGRMQCRHLGAAVEAWNEQGQPVVGEVGELVCTRPFPSMPLYFWGDTDGGQYLASYFKEWPGIWRHGDWLQIESDGSCTISGRSDATINRHGLRMGTADFYSALEHLPEVLDCMVIDLEDGQGDSKLVMFVVPAEGRQLDAELEAAMKSAIRHALSPRFVPDHFIHAPGIPRTLSGKKQELPIKRLFQGSPIAKVINLDAIANPEVIPWYAARAAAWLARGRQ
jgi:acetoacetyl-CoA synthetase